jgi:hypothetical protein
MSGLSELKLFANKSVGILFKNGGFVDVLKSSNQVD